MEYTFSTLLLEYHKINEMWISTKLLKTMANDKTQTWLSLWPNYTTL